MKYAASVLGFQDIKISILHVPFVTCTPHQDIIANRCILASTISLPVHLLHNHCLCFYYSQYRQFKYELATSLFVKTSEQGR